MLKLKDINLDAVLCYVEGNIAFFTTQQLDQQWGDDWNDAPYEHNAGTPYAFSEYDAKQGKTPWQIYRVFFDAHLNTPADLAYSGNSRYSVLDINRYAAAWLVSESWVENRVIIQAGTSLGDFIGMIHKSGGIVYLPIEA